MTKREVREEIWKAWVEGKRPRIPRPGTNLVHSRFLLADNIATKKAKNPSPLTYFSTFFYHILLLPCTVLTYSCNYWNILFFVPWLKISSFSTYIFLFSSIYLYYIPPLPSAPKSNLGQTIKPFFKNKFGYIIHSTNVVLLSAQFLHQLKKVDDMIYFMKLYIVNKSIFDGEFFWMC